VIFVSRLGQFLATGDTATVFVGAVRFLHVEVLGHVMNQQRTLVWATFSTTLFGALEFPATVCPFLVIVHNGPRRKGPKTSIASVGKSRVATNKLVLSGDVHCKCGLFSALASVITAVNRTGPIRIHLDAVLLQLFSWVRLVHHGTGPVKAIIELVLRHAFG
jgi:hypothetical protein